MWGLWNAMSGIIRLSGNPLPYLTVDRREQHSPSPLLKGPPLEWVVSLLATASPSAMCELDVSQLLLISTEGGFKLSPVEFSFPEVSPFLESLLLELTDPALSFLSFFFCSGDLLLPFFPTASTELSSLTDPSPLCFFSFLRNIFLNLLSPLLLTHNHHKQHHLEEIANVYETGNSKYYVTRFQTSRN